jgi:hypothetical protein
VRTPPESVELSLKNVRSTLRVIWNPMAVRRPTSFDAMGRPRDMEYEPRWELWDTDAEGLDYMVTRLQEEDGSFREADQRLVDLVNLINPERYGGDPSKMLQALVDAPNERALEGEEKMFRDFASAAARWGAWVNTPKSYVPQALSN